MKWNKLTSDDDIRPKQAGWYFAKLLGKNRNQIVIYYEPDYSKQNGGWNWDNESMQVGDRIVAYAGPISLPQE